MLLPESFAFHCKAVPFVVGQFEPSAIEPLFRTSLSIRKSSIAARWFRLSQPATIPNQRCVGNREVIAARFCFLAVPTRCVGAFGFSDTTPSYRRRFGSCEMQSTTKVAWTIPSGRISPSV